VVAVLGLALLPSFFTPQVSAQTLTAVPLDGGGWFSGLVQAADGRLYGYGDVFGAWRSDDGGEKWSYLNWSIPKSAIVGIGMAVQRDNSDVIYYSTYEDVFKSTDGGATWQLLLQGLGTATTSNPRHRGASQLLIRANNPSEIWLAAPRKELVGGLWRSTDGGKTWAKAGGTLFDRNEPRTLHNIPAFPDQIWVGADDGLYASVDGGKTFERIGAPGSLEGVGMISRFASGPHAGVGLVARSNDGGGVSRVTATDFNKVATYKIKASRSSFSFGYPTGLQIFSDGRASAWTTAADRHGVSTDGGVSFRLQATTLNTQNVPIWTTAEEMKRKNHPDYGTDQVIEDVKNPDKWYITGGGAPMYSLDRGLSWQYFRNGSGIAAVKTYGARISHHDPDIVYVPASDIGSAIVTDGGRSGLATYSSCKSYATLHATFRILEGPDTRKLVLAGVDQGPGGNLLLTTSDGGASWNRLNLEGSGLPGSYEGITDSVMSLTDANDYLVVLGNAGNPRNPGMWRTRDGGKRFEPVRGLPREISTGHRYDAQTCFLDRDAVKPDVRYFVARDIAFYRSTDGGTQWKPVAHPYGLKTWIWAMSADPVRSGNLWVATDQGDGGVRYSRNGGTSWKEPRQRFRARHVASCDGKIALFGTAEGDTLPRIYYSEDDGATFRPLTDSSRNFFGVQGLAVDRRGRVWVSWNSITVITP
jgi:photosystem II stability/assembly factor-like uncharacterized protein